MRVGAQMHTNEWQRPTLVLCLLRIGKLVLLLLLVLVLLRLRLRLRLPIRRIKYDLVIRMRLRLLQFRRCLLAL